MLTRKDTKKLIQKRYNQRKRKHLEWEAFKEYINARPNRTVIVRGITDSTVAEKECEEGDVVVRLDKEGFCLGYKKDGEIRTF